MSITASKAALKAYVDVILLGKSAYKITHDDAMDELRMYITKDIGEVPRRPTTRAREHYSLEREGWKRYAFYPKKGSIESFGHNMHAAVFRCDCGYVEAEKRFAVWLITKRLST